MLFFVGIPLRTCEGDLLTDRGSQYQVWADRIDAETDIDGLDEDILNFGVEVFGKQEQKGKRKKNQTAWPVQAAVRLTFHQSPVPIPQ